jgi:hypothetical protein
MFTFWNYYDLKLLRLETIMFSDATLSDIKVVLCYVLSQYPNLIDWSTADCHLDQTSLRKGPGEHVLRCGGSLKGLVIPRV